MDAPKKSVGKKPKLVIRPPKDPEPAKQAPGKPKSRSIHPSRGHSVSPDIPQTDIHTIPVHTKTRAREVIDIESDGEKTEQNGSDRVSSPPRKRQRSCEEDRSAELVGRMSTPTISDISERVRTCPETPQQISPGVILGKRRLQPYHVQSLEHEASAPRPILEETTRQHLEDMVQQQDHTRRQLEVLRQQQEETNSILFQLYQEWDPCGRKKHPEMEQRLRLIMRTMKKDPGCLAERVLEDLASLSYANEKYRKSLHSLVGYQDDRTFPAIPPRLDLDDSWTRIRREVRDAIVFEYPENAQQPEASESGYIASQINFILKGGDAILDPASYIEELEVQLGSLHTVQSLLSALLFSWVFATPDAICEEFYSPKELKMYKTTLLSGKSPQRQRSTYLLTLYRWSSSSPESRQDGRSADVQRRRRRGAEEQIQQANQQTAPQPPHSSILMLPLRTGPGPRKQPAQLARGRKQAEANPAPQSQRLPHPLLPARNPL
jgi:hypothetical protein